MKNLYIINIYIFFYIETVIWWIVIDVVAPHSSKNVRKIWSDYIDKLIQIEDYEPMSLHCADVVNYMMGK